MERLHTYQNIKYHRPATQYYPGQCANDENLVHTEEEHTKGVGEVRHCYKDKHHKRNPSC